MAAWNRLCRSRLDEHLRKYKSVATFPLWSRVNDAEVWRRTVSANPGDGLSDKSKLANGSGNAITRTPFSALGMSLCNFAHLEKQEWSIIARAALCQSICRVLVSYCQISPRSFPRTTSNPCKPPVTRDEGDSSSSASRVAHELQAVALSVSPTSIRASVRPGQGRLQEGL